MPLSVLVNRIGKLAQLSPVERDSLAGLPFVEKSLGDGEYLAREGGRVSQCTILLSGFLLRRKVVGDRNQVIAIYVPGDAPDLQTLHLPVMDHDITSAGPSRVALVSHAVLSRLLDKSPRLAHLFWRDTLVDAAIFREWVCNVGARNALEKIAHLICELAARLEAVGLVTNNQFHIPLTQQDFADASGLSVVHVNRTVRELRRAGLISWEARMMTLLKRRELEQVGDFSMDYLHQRAIREQSNEANAPAPPSQRSLTP